VLLWVSLLGEVDLNIVILANLGDDSTSLANDFGMEVRVNLELK
jgi:hypothetical protein